MDWCNVEYIIFSLYKWIKIPKGLAVTIIPIASTGSINMSLSHVPKTETWPCRSNTVSFRAMLNWGLAVPRYRLWLLLSTSSPVLDSPLIMLCDVYAEPLQAWWEYLDKLQVHFALCLQLRLWAWHSRPLQTPSLVLGLGRACLERYHNCTRNSCPSLWWLFETPTQILCDVSYQTMKNVPARSMLPSFLTSWGVTVF